MKNLKKSVLLQLLMAIFLNLVSLSLMAQEPSSQSEPEQRDTTQQEDDWDDWKEDDWDHEEWERKKEERRERYQGVRLDFGWNNEDAWTDVRVGMFDVGFSTYMNNGSVNLPAELDDYELLYGGSLNFNWHVLRHRIPVVKKDLWIEYGLTLSWMQYKFSNDFRIEEDVIPVSLIDDGTRYKKNKLKTTFLNVPVMLTLTPGKRKSFYLSAGMYGGLLLNAKQKLKTEEGDKTRIKDDFNLNKFRYGIAARIGTGPIAFYAQYSLNDLFKTGQGPELTPLNVGVTLVNF